MFSGKSVKLVVYRRDANRTTSPFSLRLDSNFATAGSADPTITSFSICRFFSIMSRSSPISGKYFSNIIPNPRIFFNHQQPKARGLWGDSWLPPRERDEKDGRDLSDLPSPPSPGPPSPSPSLSSLLSLSSLWPTSPSAALCSRPPWICAPASRRRERRALRRSPRRQAANRSPCPSLRRARRFAPRASARGLRHAA